MEAFRKLHQPAESPVAPHPEQVLPYSDVLYI